MHSKHHSKQNLKKIRSNSKLILKAPGLLTLATRRTPTSSSMCSSRRATTLPSSAKYSSCFLRWRASSWTTSHGSQRSWTTCARCARRWWTLRKQYEFLKCTRDDKALNALEVLHAQTPAFLVSHLKHGGAKILRLVLQLVAARMRCPIDLGKYVHRRWWDTFFIPSSVHSVK